MEIPGAGYVVLPLLAGLFAVVSVRYAVRLANAARVLRYGVRAGGECVRVESEPHSDATRHYFAFYTADRTRVEFEDLASWSTNEGTPVTVTYDPRDPRRTATVAGRGSWSTLFKYLLLCAGCGLAALGFATLLCQYATGGL